jgi:hypothetical protein
MALRHVALPKWVVECCGLRPNASVADLASAGFPSDDSTTAALEFFVGRLMATHAGDIEAITVYPDGATLSAEELIRADWPTRVANVLQRSGLLNHPEQLASITYGRLLGLKGLGLKSAIAFALKVQHMTQGQVISEEIVSESQNGLQQEREALVGALRSLIARDWADEVTGSDRRFADFLPSRGDSVASAAEAFLQALESADYTQPQLPIHTSDPNAIGKWVEGLESRVKELELMPLEALLADYLATVGRLKGQRLQALLARLGWLGRPPVTLQEAGDLLDVTRERIRQIESKVLKRIPKQPVFAPAVIRGLQVLADAAPIELHVAERLLQERGVSAAPFSIESLIGAAATLSIDCPIRVVSAKGVHLVVRSADAPHLGQILKIARSKAGASGVVSVHEVAARVSASHIDLNDLLDLPPNAPVAKFSKCTPEEVSTVLSASPGFRPLGGAWFWATDLASGRNRLVNICRSMLSVTAPISVSRLRDGVKREYTFRNLSGPQRYDLRVPPADVLRAFLRDHPDFSVDESDMARPTKPIDYRQELGVSEQILVEVLRGNPSAVLDRATILRECLARGVNVQTLGVALTYSCLVEHVDINIWCLRGVDVNPAAVEALRRANALRPRERRVRDFGWTPDGKLWIATVVPESTQTFVFGAPAGTRAFLAGQKFAAFSHDGVPFGTLGVTQDGSVYGLSTFQNQSDCDPGDILVFEFDLAESKATLVLGDEELLDRYASE